MSGEMIKVRLTGPAKVGARWLKPGDEEVTAEEKADLVAAGLIGPDEAAADVTGAPATRTYTEAEWESAVQAAALLLAGAAFDGELSKLEGEVRSIVALSESEKAAMTAKLEASAAERDQLKVQIAELESVVVDLEAQLAARSADPSPAGAPQAPDTQNTPPEKAAKTAPKKGAATTPKG